MEQAKIDAVAEKARNIRIGIINALGLGRPGHLGGSMSAADIVAVLYFHKIEMSSVTRMNINIGQVFLMFENCFSI